MRVSSLIGFFSTLMMLSACGGGDGDACVLDSDCADFSNVCIEGLCRPAGELPSEGGTRVDSGTTSRDAGPADAGSPAMDAGPADAGSADAMAAPEDAMPMDGPTCSVVPMSWTVSMVGALVSCGGATVDTPVTIRTVGPCSFMASTIGTTGISGTFDLNGDDTLSGSLAPGSAPATMCSGGFDPAENALVFSCGACSIRLTTTP